MSSTNHELVVTMNKAFGNPGADVVMGDEMQLVPKISVSKLRKQCLNIADELGELYVALGADKALIEQAIASLKWAASKVTGNKIDLTQTRDALCDIHVFAYGAHHFMGINADRDMRDVVGGVMTRFIKNEDDKRATIALHAAKGVTDVRFEGNYPTMVMKSNSDQKDAPEGKFLKSASYHDTVFEAVEAVFVD